MRIISNYTYYCFVTDLLHQKQYNWGQFRISSICLQHLGMVNFLTAFGESFGRCIYRRACIIIFIFELPLFVHDERTNEKYDQIVINVLLSFFCYTIYQWQRLCICGISFVVTLKTICKRQPTQIKYDTKGHCL